MRDDGSQQDFALWASSSCFLEILLSAFPLSWLQGNSPYESVVINKQVAFHAAAIPHLNLRANVQSRHPLVPVEPRQQVRADLRDLETDLPGAPGVITTSRGVLQFSPL